MVDSPIFHSQGIPRRSRATASSATTSPWRSEREELRVKYGRVDPTGEVREYSYTSGNRCDPDTRKQIAEDRSGGGGSRGANGHGFYDYKRGKFVMADGRRVTVVVNQQNKARGRRY